MDQETALVTTTTTVVRAGAPGLPDFQGYPDSQARQAQSDLLDLLVLAALPVPLGSLVRRALRV
jgi:hypothetical protein